MASRTGVDTLVNNYVPKRNRTSGAVLPQYCNVVMGEAVGMKDLLSAEYLKRQKKSAL